MRSFISRLCISYAVFVALWFLSNVFFQDAIALLVALDKFAEYFLVAALPVLFISVCTRYWKSAVFAIVPVLIAGYFYGPLLLPLNSSTTTMPNAETIRIGTYNLWNHNQNYNGIRKLVDDIDVDVLAIQELTEEQKEPVVSRLSKTHPYYFISEPVYGGTTALFSKRELHNIEALDFGIDRPAILAEIKFNGLNVTVVSAHLNPSYWAYANQPLRAVPARFHQYIKDQNAQANKIIEAVQERENSQASVLACDCNSQETASTNKLLRGYFHEALRTMGFRWNSEIDNDALSFEQSLAHIDYVWFQGNIKLFAVYRAKLSAGSDHQPIVAEFSSL